MRGRFDVGIVGGGFSGSLLAAVLAGRGRRVVVIDAASHPRFAIGESSTPIADLLLAQIADRFELEEVRPLCRYGSWKRARPDLVCGKKRGFSYFSHRRGAAFDESRLHERSLLVTASLDDERADTHWMRSDVDHFFFRLAERRGATTRQGTVTDARWTGDRWKLAIAAPLRPAGDSLECDFLVDAAGRAGKLRESLGIVDHSHQLRTRTIATYGHFVDVDRWSEWLAGHGQPIDDHPFDCDAAAQHHLTDEGWLWMLRMDDRRVSVGWTRPGAARVPPRNGDFLHSLGITDYPPLRDLMARARLVDPDGGLVASGPLQYLASRVTGPGFALLPTAAVTIDPLHSSGIAHGLSGVLSVARILLESATPADRDEALAGYERTVYQEAQMMDRLTAGCYLAMPWFELFTTHAMAYFVAAIRCEEEIAGGRTEGALWSADHPPLATVVEAAYDRMRRLVTGRRPSPSEIAAHAAWMRAALAPWNHAGLMRPSAHNMYRYTAATKES